MRIGARMSCVGFAGRSGVAALEGAGVGAAERVSEYRMHGRRWGLT